MVLTQATFYVLIVFGNIVTVSSQECEPRDVVAAGRTCYRACLQDGTCRKKNKECICDGFCGLSCLTKRCPPLREPLNGNMVIIPSDRTIGAEVTYSCNSGYVISDQTNRECQEDKTWSGEDPMCTLSTTRDARPECAERDVVAAGRHCEKACQLGGTCKKQNRECVCDGLCGLTCLRKRCSSLLAPRNGSLVISPQDRTIGAEVTYSCNNGYVISGRRNRICQANKMWSGTQPTCNKPPTKVPCLLLELSDGILEYRDGNDRVIEQPHHGDKRRATCSEGYVLNGMFQSICSLGVWQHALPTCQRIPCPILDLEDGALAYLDKNNQRVFEPHHGDIRVAVCRDGRTLRGTSQTRCMSGSWQDELPSCEAVKCDHEPLENGAVTYTLDGVDYQEPVHGVMRSYNCEAGYTVDDDEPSKCDAGSWTRGLPVCYEKPCNTTDLVGDDWDIVYNFPEGRDELAELMKPPTTVASFTCKTIGYVTAGIDTRTCRQGQWDGQNPSCVRNTCPSIQLVNGILEYRDIDNIVTSNPRHGDSMRAICNSGYYLQGSTQRLCWDGQWENGVPLCLERPCNKNDLSVGDWDWVIQYINFKGRNDPEEFLMSPGTLARLRCNTIGYETIGRDRRTCRRGEWTGQNPSCKRRKCQSIQLDNGRFEYRDSDNIVILDPLHGDFRSATCNRGYYIQGTAETRCWDGQWEDELPTCLEATLQNCPFERDEVAAGRNCERGCRPDGTCRKQNRECICDGRCGPVCLKKRCPPLANPGNVRIIIDPSGLFIGSEATYLCDDGFEVVGNGVRICQSNKTWSGTNPTCQKSTTPFETTPIPPSCERLTTPLNGKVISVQEDGDVVAKDTVITFQCNDGYERTSGNLRRTCRENGSWSGSDVVCSAEAPPSVAQLRLVGGNDTAGRLEIYLDGVWGTVCDDFWDLVDANVACRQLGFPGAISAPRYAVFGQGSDPTHLDDVSCTGEETDLVSCSHTRDENCAHSEDAGVVCIPPSDVSDTCPTAIIDNGRLTRDDFLPFTQEARHGDWRRFTCEPGYTVHGEERSQCLDGEWTQEKPTCIEATCRIESIANGDTTRRDGSQFTQDARHDEWRRVICDDGYTIVGQMWSICRSGRWSPDSPTCEETQCPAVENNGEYERILYHGQESAAQSFPSGTVLEIDCAEGRVPEGPKISSCWRGLWDPPILLCVHTGCASGCQVPHLQNGYFTTTHDWTRLQPMACVSFESYISVRCQEGMIREGDRYYRCDESGEWSNPSGIDSTCRLCPSTHCVVPYIENGHYTYSTGGAPLVNGSCFANRRYLYVVCDDGMQRIGERYYYCRDGELDTRNDGNVFTLCTTGTSSEREQICPSPGEENLVETFIGNDYTPLNEQDSFREGDFITSRCQNPKTQQLHGSLRRQCEGGQWSGDPARCVLTNFEIFVGNTAIQNVTENGTVIVYPVRGYVTIDCKLLNGLRGTVSMYKDNVQLPSFYVGSGRNHRRLRISNPSDANSGTYRCEFNRQSLTIVILFKDIRCPPPENPARGTWTHQTAPTNPGGNLGYIFMETLSLNCNLGYRPSHSARPTCSYHSTWINMSHTCIRQD